MTYIRGLMVHPLFYEESLQLLVPFHCGYKIQRFFLLPLSPPGWRGLSSRSGRAGGRVGVWAGGRAAGRPGGRLPNLRNPYLCNRLMIFSIRSSVELSRPVGVHCYGHCPFAPYGLAHGPKTCQICHKLGPDFAERISLKLLDGFTPFKVPWTCLDL